MRARVAVLILILLLSALAVFPFPARGDTWTPNPTRTITPSTTSPRFGFSVTISFTAPLNRSTLYLNEGTVDYTGDAWYTPHDYASFKINTTSWTATPAPGFYDGKSGWIWSPDEVGPLQKITLTYNVLVASSVALRNYSIDGTVGRPVAGVFEEYHIGKDTSIGIIPAKLTVVAGTDKPLYVGGDTVVVTAAVADPSGAPVSGATVTATFAPSGATIPLTGSVPGKYNGSLKLAPDAAVGLWTVLVVAKDSQGNTGGAATSFQVGFSVLSMTATTDKSSYRLFDAVSLSATLKAPDGSGVSKAKVKATLSPVNTVINLDETSPGVYRGSYKTDALTPLGSWSAHVEGTGGTGNVGATASADVSWTVDRAILVLSPTLAAKNVKRLETVNLAVIVTYPDTGRTPLFQTKVGATVDNPAFPALTTTTDPSGKVSFVWNLGVDAPLGDHTITVEVNAPTGAAVTSATFTVLPTTLDITFSLPQGVTQGDQVRLGATARYANGQPVTGATARLTSARAGIQNQAMAYNQTTSQYETSVKFTGNGTVDIVVQIQDAYGNSGQATTQLTVGPQRAPPPPGVDWTRVGLVIGVVIVIVVAVTVVAVARRRGKAPKGPS